MFYSVNFEKMVALIYLSIIGNRSCHLFTCVTFNCYNIRLKITVEQLIYNTNNFQSEVLLSFFSQSANTISSVINFNLVLILQTIQIFEVILQNNQFSSFKVFSLIINSLYFLLLNTKVGRH
jgi:hypothetical protein